MATSPVAIRPGVESTSTPLSNEAGISDANLVRFFQGPREKAPYLQKLGGWSRLTNNRLTGTARGMHPWRDLSTLGYIGIGTEQVLEVFALADGSINDVTPLRTTANLATPFSTVAGSPIVTVYDPGHGASAGDWINIATATYVDGLVLQGPYQVLSAPAPTSNTYAINVGANANFGVVNQGTTFSFTSALASPNLIVALGLAPLAANQKITVYVPTTVGGMTVPQGIETIAIVAGQPTIMPGGFGTAAATVFENGGQVQILYPIPSQLDGANPFAYGVGPYGQGAYGQGAGSNPPPLPRQWSIDNFGQYMLAAYLNGPLYQWLPPIALGNRATLVPGAPQFSAAIYVAMPEEQVFSLGSDTGFAQDPLLIKFSDIGNYVGAAQWTASATNQAGSQRLTRGSRIVGGMQGPQQGLIWTDLDLWVANYLGYPLVYGFTMVGEECGLIAPRAAAWCGARVFWVGAKGFWQYDFQTVSAVPCSVWDFMYGQGQLDLAWKENVIAAPNADFSEVAFYFPTVGSGGLPTSFVKMNLQTGLWDKGTLTRTAWCDASDIARPCGCDGPNGLIQQHEVATDADGVSMPSWALTGMFKLEGGGKFMSIERIIPDFIFNPGGSVNISLWVYRWSNDPNPRIFGPFTANAAREFIITRCRGKFLRLYFDFSPLGSFCRVGTLLERGAAAGSR